MTNGANGWVRRVRSLASNYWTHTLIWVVILLILLTPSGYPVLECQRLALTAAFVYSQDESSEEFIGEWAEKRGIRDQLFIATKVRWICYQLIYGLLTSGDWCSILQRTNAGTLMSLKGSITSATTQRACMSALKTV